MPYSVNTVRRELSCIDHACATFDKGTAEVATVKPLGTAACSTPLMDASRRSSGTLPRPLPIKTMAEERSAAAGSTISGPPKAPTCTKRIGTVSAPPLAPAFSRQAALLPHR